MELIFWLAWLLALVVSILMIVAQFQLFAIRRSMDELVNLTRLQAGVPAPPKPVAPKSNTTATALVVFFLLLVTFIVMGVLITSPSR